MKLMQKMIEYIKENKYVDYCELCENNRYESIECYKEINPEYYESVINNIHNIDSPFNKYIKNAEELKKQGNIDEELSVLKDAINIDIDTPGAYERASILYSKKGVAKRWFENGNWTIPNCTNMTKKLLARLKKLEERISKI